MDRPRRDQRPLRAPAGGAHHGDRADRVLGPAPLPRPPYRADGLPAGDRGRGRRRQALADLLRQEAAHRRLAARAARRRARSACSRAARTGTATRSGGSSTNPQTDILEQADARRPGRSPRTSAASPTPSGDLPGHQEAVSRGRSRAPSRSRWRTSTRSRTRCPTTYDAPAGCSTRTPRCGPAPSGLVAGQDGRADVAALRGGLRRADRAGAAPGRAARRCRRTRAPAGRAGCSTGSTPGCRSTLTAGQRAVGEQILDDLAAGHPMHRLLQGEVGSGKTVVALRAMLQVVDAGGQAALLAPTEVLAQQHAPVDRRRCSATWPQGGMLGGADDGTRVALLTGSLGAAARKSALLDAASGAAGHRRRHARAARGAGPVRRPRPGRGRRAAPVRRRAAGGAHREGGRRAAARAGDDRDPDPAHGGDDRLR